MLWVEFYLELYFSMIFLKIVGIFSYKKNDDFVSLYVCFLTCSSFSIIKK